MKNYMLEKIELKDKSVLSNLFQLYLHDITLYLPMSVNEHGLFDYKWIDQYFYPDAEKEGLYAYFIKAGKKYAGFVLINKDFLILEEDKKDNYNMSEFFVLNEYKNKGVGKFIANKIFDMYPGTWEIKPVPKSAPAMSFWKRTINERTKGNFTLKLPKPNRATFVFKV